MKNFASFLRTLTFFTLFVALQCPAQGKNSPHERIRTIAADFVKTRVITDNSSNISTQVSAGKVDQRIKVPSCEVPFEASASENSLTQSNVTVRVACPGSNWFLYVMVNVQQMQQVVVARQAVSPGELLSEEQLEVIRLDINQLRGSTYSTIESLAGARSKRRLRAGQPIEPSLLCYVCKGDSVVISADVAGLQIKASGVAEQDGNIGDTIRVENTSSRRQIDATVVSASEVTVGI
ncbi:flagellar basal body P-ring formation chaperone FlgA [Lacimicrobium alkaliphilum]|uniref:Flagella basal body P-ring formation protein FlgA n=1 Tax=Lacimicrobium alkaliphilum TaxID=1526571 RepID=A0ABQ1RLF2_9ALTE|nr:flagellar basal body P-ring formation chaperone FlgA [Lacimicrobium alkaliphilum]GGD72174.1 flagella basal body P-ring formation protein FlgA [Lacimicrobium alkaliphilum]